MATSWQDQLHSECASGGSPLPSMLTISWRPEDRLTNCQQRWQRCNSHCDLCKLWLPKQNNGLTDLWSKLEAERMFNGRLGVLYLLFPSWPQGQLSLSPLDIWPATIRINAQFFKYGGAPEGCRQTSAGWGIFIAVHPQKAHSSTDNDLFIHTWLFMYTTSRPSSHVTCLLWKTDVLLLSSNIFSSFLFKYFSTCTDWTRRKWYFHKRFSSQEVKLLIYLKWGSRGRRRTHFTQKKPRPQGDLKPEPSHWPLQTVTL